MSLKPDFVDRPPPTFERNSLDRHTSAVFSACYLQVFSDCRPLTSQVQVARENAQCIGRVTIGLLQEEADVRRLVLVRFDSRPVTLVVDLDRSRDVVPVLARVLHVDVARFTDYLTVIREV
mgnify:CR=1 FL=1